MQRPGNMAQNRGTIEYQNGALAELSASRHEWYGYFRRHFSGAQRPYPYLPVYSQSNLRRTLLDKDKPALAGDFREAETKQASKIHNHLNRSPHVQQAQAPFG